MSDQDKPVDTAGDIPAANQDKARKHRHLSTEEVAKLLSEVANKADGETAEDICKRWGISTKSLQRWKKRVAADAQLSAASGKPAASSAKTVDRSSADFELRARDPYRSASPDTDAAGAVFTLELAATICKVIRRGNFREMACAQVGISSQTLRNWLRRGAAGEEPFAQFSLDLLLAESVSEDALITGIRLQGQKDWKALAWIAERAYSQRWGYKAQAQVDVQKEVARVLETIHKVLGPEDATRVFTALVDSEPGALPDPSDSGRPRRPGTVEISSRH